MRTTSVRRIPTAIAVLIFTILAAVAVLFLPFRASAGQAPEEIRDFSVQSVALDTVESSETDLRFLFTVGSLHYTRVGFVISKTNKNPTVGGAECVTLDTTVVYTAVYADGEPIAAPGGRYWVAIKVPDVPNDSFDTPLYVKAFVDDGSVRYSAVKSTTVCEAFGNEKIAGDFTPILRFVVASDIHYGQSANAQDTKLQNLMEGAYGYSDSHAKYTALDGVFFVGDIADRGKTTELNRFFTAFYGYRRQGTEAQAILGNHEFYTEPENTVSRYLAASGYDSADRHITIAGYHFILMSPSHYDGFNNEKISWLSAELAAAAADDPTGKKPIFVFQHHPPYNTVYGSEDEWGVTNLAPVFERYPQVVDFAGHSHFPINDPRSVWQGDYTAFNTGSCREWGMDIAGVTSKTVFAIGNEGGWSYSELSGTLYDPGKYYVVEVNAASRILVRAFDVETGVEVMEPIFLASVGDPSRFAYTDARANHEETPRFAANAEVQSTISQTSATFRFPRTVSGAYVQHYRCELRRGETLIDTVYRLDCGFLFPAPETLTVSFTGLSADTEYTASIIPITAWENEGEPLIVNFSTSETTPLIFSAQFQENGAATDGVSGATLTKRGSPTTLYDGNRDAYYAVFDGEDDAFEFYGIGSFYSNLRSAFTFETYLCMDAKPGSSYVAPFANEENGGFGFEYDASGNMNFWIKVNGDWISAGASLTTGQWVHLVATFNGGSLILYVNGSEVANTAVSGAPAVPNTDHLSIGADANGYNGSQNFACCKVAVANVYQVAKSASEVSDMYAALTN